MQVNQRRFRLHRAHAGAQTDCPGGAKNQLSGFFGE